MQLQGSCLDMIYGATLTLHWPRNALILKQFDTQKIKSPFIGSAIVRIISFPNAMPLLRHQFPTAIEHCIEKLMDRILCHFCPSDQQIAQQMSSPSYHFRHFKMTCPRYSLSISLQQGWARSFWTPWGICHQPASMDFGGGWKHALILLGSG